MTDAGAGTETNLGALGWALSSPFPDDERARRAAREVVEAPDPSALLGRLFPILMNQKTVGHAFEHLERAGADLDELSVPTAVLRATYPLSEKPLWPVPPGPRWPLRHLADTMGRHRRLLWESTLALARRLEPRRFVLLSARAMEALFPSYHGRLGFDVDLWFPTLSDALDGVEVAVRELGFALKFANLYDGQGAPYLGTSLHKRTEADGEALVGIMSRGRQFHDEPLDERGVEVVWEGHALQAPPPEDLLLMVAHRTLKRRDVQVVNVNDVAVILRGDQPLDLARVLRLSRAHGLDEPLGLLLAHAEATWPGTVPEALRDLAERAPRALRALTWRALHGAEDDPALPWERLAFTLANARRHHPSWGWGRAGGALIASRTRTLALRGQNRIRKRLGLPTHPVPTPQGRPVPLCGAASSETTRDLPGCIGHRVDARWGDGAAPEAREAADRLLALVPAERHDCRRLRARVRETA